jgi:hypothetical protein
MDAIRYATGELVKKGDEVEISYSLADRLISLLSLKVKKRKENGTVSYVYDPVEASGPNGQNDYGVGIKITDTSSIWCIPGANVRLLTQSKTEPGEVVNASSAAGLSENHLHD